jgi:polysaccharide biosynthesis protein PslG
MRARDLVWLLLAAFLVASSGWQPASAQVADRIARLIGDAAVPNGLGVSVHFVAGHADSVARIKDTGFRIVRTDLLWAQVEQQQGVYDWAPFDALVADLRAAGLVPLFILDYSNPRYTTPVRGREADPSKAFTAPSGGEARAGFMRYARAAALRYGSNVIWEIWNEPDLNFGQPIDLDAYVDFAIEACKTVKGCLARCPGYRSGRVRICLASAADSPVARRKLLLRRN